jgi:TM2 domain-containing membrane protein YozV
MLSKIGHAVCMALESGTGFVLVRLWIDFISMVAYTGPFWGLGDFTFSLSKQRSRFLSQGLLIRPERVLTENSR